MSKPKFALRPCRTCEKSFRPRVKWQLFCSIPCRSSHHNSRRSHARIWAEIRSAIEADSALSTTLATSLGTISAFVASKWPEEGDGKDGE